MWSNFLLCPQMKGHTALSDMSDMVGVLTNTARKWQLLTHFPTAFYAVVHPGIASMSMLEKAISCLRADPAHAFGLLILICQPFSHEILISVIERLLPSQGSSAECSPLKDLRCFLSGLSIVPASLWEWQLCGASLVLFLTGLLFGPGTQKLCCWTWPRAMWKCGM